MMNLGIIAASHDRAGIKHVMDLGLGYAEFDVNADDIAYVTGNVDDIKAALSEYDVKIGAVGRWGRFRINDDGSFNKKEQQDEFDLIDFCRKVAPYISAVSTMLTVFRTIQTSLPPSITSSR